MPKLPFKNWSLELYETYFLYEVDLCVTLKEILLPSPTFFLPVYGQMFVLARKRSEVHMCKCWHTTIIIKVNSPQISCLMLFPQIFYTFDSFLFLF